MSLLYQVFLECLPPALFDACWVAAMLLWEAAGLPVLLFSGSKLVQFCLKVHFGWFLAKSAVCDEHFSYMLFGYCFYNPAFNLWVKTLVPFSGNS